MKEKKADEYDIKKQASFPFQEYDSLPVSPWLPLPPTTLRDRDSLSTLQVEVLDDSTQMLPEIQQRIAKARKDLKQFMVRFVLFPLRPSLSLEYWVRISV